MLLLKRAQLALQQETKARDAVSSGQDEWDEHESAAAGDHPIPNLAVFHLRTHLQVEVEPHSLLSQQLHPPPHPMTFFPTPNFCTPKPQRLTHLQVEVEPHSLLPVSSALGQLRLQPAARCSTLVQCTAGV
jgi:hypothetical protein